MTSIAVIMSSCMWLVIQAEVTLNEQRRLEEVSEPQYQIDYRLDDAPADFAFCNNPSGASCNGRGTVMANGG
eukprot:SAG31_NODE_33830_length_339_cov_1.275000_1_plen_71_part_01